MNTFCGVGPVPKGKVMGSLNACMKKRQVRQYGIKKANFNILDAEKKRKKTISRATFEAKRKAKLAPKPPKKVKLVAARLPEDTPKDGPVVHQKKGPPGRKKTKKPVKAKKGKKRNKKGQFKKR
tara:strand:- start:887 stop:1258 length:372 start_codon:yes stop_codon:yes gene_type:complete